MPKVMQNIVLLMERNDLCHCVSLKAGHMLLNRFCIDEDAAFESTGVYYLKKTNAANRWKVCKYCQVDVSGGKWRSESKAKGQRKYITLYISSSMYAALEYMIMIIETTFYNSS